MYRLSFFSHSDIQKGVVSQNGTLNGIKAQGLSKLTGGGFSSMMSEEVNQQMYNQLVHNIHQTIKNHAQIHKLVGFNNKKFQKEEEAFEKLFIAEGTDH